MVLGEEFLVEFGHLDVVAADLHRLRRHVAHPVPAGSRTGEVPGPRRPETPLNQGA
jgi:hypothetical protein